MVRNRPYGFLGGIQFGILVCSFLVSLPPALSAASGTEAAAFLNIPVGAAPAALGGAYSALATDAYAPVYNPGAIAFAAQSELAGQHLSYLESINYEYLGFVHPFAGRHALGFALQYLGTGDITGRDQTGALTSAYSNHYAAYSFSYGFSVNDRVGIGATAKAVEAKLADVSASAFAGDLGLYFKATDKLSLAGVMTNAGSKLKFIDQADSLPLAFKLGAAYQMSWHWKFTAEGDFHKEGDTTGHLGVEWMPVSVIALRAGYKTLGTKEAGGIAGLTAGVGLQMWGQDFSYAWLPYGDLGSAQYFSMTLKFGKKSLRQKVAANYDYYTSSKEPAFDQLMQLLNEDDIQEANTRRTVLNHE